MPPNDTKDRPLGRAMFLLCCYNSCRFIQLPLLSSEGKAACQNNKIYLAMMV